ncbi:hypothetical protein RND81_11G147000 [Saponaria officinalis]|uniref:Dehydrin n=1 Tax=Saponaria officinalis TaxID=3572 RepID=A0AAW1HMA2_SAPOF
MSNPYPTGFQSDNPEAPASDRGLFDCFGKKEEEDEDIPKTEAQHKSSLLDKLHRSNNSTSSSSDEEVEEDGVKIRKPKKKGLTEKIKEKLPGHKNEAATNAEEMHPDEKKGFLEKIKEKLPGHHKDEAVITPHPTSSPVPVPAPPHCQSDGHCGGEDGVHEQQEKKGILEKIKEKLPGGHKDGDEARINYG